MFRQSGVIDSIGVYACTAEEDEVGEEDDIYLLIMSSECCI